METTIEYRNYQQADLEPILELFNQTVHMVNAKDYTKAQLDAWAPKVMDTSVWHQRLSNHHTLVAIKDDIIVGFGDISDEGYLDHLFVHYAYQHQGIATALCDRLEAFVDGLITTDASITAKPFFLARGYIVLQKQTVIRQGIELTNYHMVKPR